MDSALSDSQSRVGKTRIAMIPCEKHGDVEVNQRMIRQVGERLEWWPTDCPKCHDEKRAAQEKKDAAKKKKQAEAMEERRRETRKRGSGVPRRFQLAAFEPAYSSQSKTRIAKYCETYADNFDKVLETGRCLILSGGVGTGKTHLSCAIANKVLENYSVYYTTAMRLGRMVKDTYSRDSERSEGEVIASLVRHDLLIIDEVGMQFGTDAEKMILFEVINGRYENMRPTIVSANMTLDELKSYVGERVIDRMRENDGKILVFDWNSER